MYMLLMSNNLYICDLFIQRKVSNPVSYPNHRVISVAASGVVGITCSKNTKARLSFTTKYDDYIDSIFFIRWRETLDTSCLLSLTLGRSAGSVRSDFWAGSFPKKSFLDRLKYFLRQFFSNFTFWINFTSFPNKPSSNTTKVQLTLSDIISDYLKLGGHIFC